MKKLIFIFAILFLSLISLAQYPNGTQYLGTDSNVVRARGGFQGRFININYADTAAANLDRIRQYPGAQIYTSVDNLIWYRNFAATAWIQISSGAGGLFARTDARNNTGNNMYFSAADQSLHIDSLFNFNVTTTSGSINLVSAGGVTLQSVNGSILAVNTTDVTLSGLDSIKIEYQGIVPTISSLGDYKFQVRSPAGGLADYTGSISTLAANGVVNVGDTIQQGGSIIKFTYIEVPSHLTDGAPFTHIRYGNLPEAQSIGGLVPPYPTALTYNPSTIGIDRWYKESNNDTNYFHYGGAISTVTRQSYDSGSTRYRFDNKDILLPSQGVEALYQIMLPRDSTRFRIARDGQQASVAVMQSDFGDSWGYNTQVYSDAGIPDMPISTYKANLDFRRNIDNTRRYKMTGNGVAQYLSAYKTYQTAINSSTYEAGNYVSKVVGFHAYGTMYTNLSTATKAKTLLVSAVDSSFGFVAQPQYRYTNDIINGYGFWMKGDSDYNHISGWLTVGPTLPTRANSGQEFVHRVSVTGDIWASDTVHAFISDANGYSVRLPYSVGTQAGIGFWIQDTAAQQADLLMNQPASLDSRYFRIRVGNNYQTTTYGNDGTGFRIRFETGANSANISTVWRNGNWAFGNSVAIQNLRLYKKGAFGGSVYVEDTLTLNKAPLLTDTTGFDVLMRSRGVNKDVFTIPSNVLLAGLGGSAAWGSITGTLSSQTDLQTELDLKLLKAGDSYTTTTGTGLALTSSTLTSGNLVSFASTGTAAASNTQTVLNIETSGANATSTQTTYGATFSNTHTGTSSTNYAATFTASGGTTNHGLQSTPSIIIGSPTLNANDGLILTNRDNGNYSGISIYSLSLASRFQIGQAGMTRAGAIDINTTSGSISLSPLVGVHIGPSFTAATAFLHIKANGTAASTGQIKLNESASRLTTPESGNINFVSDNLEFTETSTVYILAKTLTATATLDFDLSAVNYQDLTITVNGAAVNDAVSFSVDAAAWVADVTYSATVTAANTVTVRCSRVGGGGAANPGAGTFRAAVIRY